MSGEWGGQKVFFSKIQAGSQKNDSRVGERSEVPEVRERLEKIYKFQI